MTEVEKNVVKSEIIEELQKKYDIVPKKQHRRFVRSLKVWITGANRFKDSPFYEAFGPVAYYRAWEHIRGLATLICGESYVRDIEDIDYADDLANELCEFVYQKRIDYIKEHENGR
jgi:hypothetical protein